MYFIRFKTSLLIQLITCFYYSYSIGNPLSIIFINDVAQLFLPRLVKKLMLKSILNLKESVGHKHEASTVDLNIF